MDSNHVPRRPCQRVYPEAALVFFDVIDLGWGRGLLTDGSDCGMCARRRSRRPWKGAGEVIFLRRRAGTEGAQQLVQHSGNAQQHRHANKHEQNRHKTPALSSFLASTRCLCAALQLPHPGHVDAFEHHRLRVPIGALPVPAVQ